MWAHHVLLPAVLLQDFVRLAVLEIGFLLTINLVHHLDLERCGGDVGEMWGRCGGDMGEMWARYGRDMGRDVGEMWSGRCGRDVGEI